MLFLRISLRTLLTLFSGKPMQLWGTMGRCLLSPDRLHKLGNRNHGWRVVFFIACPQALNQPILPGRQMHHFAHPSDDSEQPATAPLVREIRSHLTWPCSLRVTKATIPKERLAGFSQFPLNIDTVAICQRHGGLPRAEAISPTQERRGGTWTIAGNLPV